MVSEVIAGAMRFTGAGYSPEETLSVVKQLAAMGDVNPLKVHRPSRVKLMDAVAMICPRLRGTEGSGLNSSVSTPFGTTCNTPGSTPKSVAMSAAEQRETVTMWRSRPATLDCIPRNRCQRRIISRHHQRGSPAKATLRSRVMG